MNRLTPNRPSLVGVITTIALVSAVSAAPVLAAVVVRSADIVNGEVKTPDLGKGAVTTPKFAADAVDGTKVNESTLGIVPNADQLDGRDSTTFLSGSGRVLAGRASVSRGAIGAIFSSTLGAQIGFNVAYQCPGGSPSVPGKMEFRNRSETAWEVWYQDGGDDPVFVEVPANGTAEFAANEQSHSVKFRIARAGGGGQATVVYSVTDGATSCKTSGLVLLAN